MPVTLVIGVNCWKTASPSLRPLKSTPDRSFHLTALALHTFTTAIDNEAARRLPFIQRLGRPIQSLTFDTKFMCAVEPLFHARSVPIESVVFQFTAFSYKPHTSWWAPLHQALGVDTVRLEGLRHLSFYDSCEVAKGVAYALLDPRSPTSVVHVYLGDDPIPIDRIHHMNAVLQASRPWEELGASEPPRVRESSCGHTKTLQLAVQQVSADDIECLVEFLQRMGGQLDTLSRKVADLKLGAADLLSILNACPQLRRLHLHGSSVADFAWLPLAYDSGHGCHLEAFVWQNGHVDDPRAILQLVESCNEPSSMTHRLLRELVYQDASYPDGLVRDISQRFEKNRTLRYVGLNVYSTDPDLARERLQVHVDTESVSLANKIAFISAVDGRLDTESMRTVLGFARGTVRRTVDCLRD